MWDGVNDSETDFNYSQETSDLTKWDRILTIGNVFNRLVLYRGAYYHRSDVGGFGKDKYDGRLFQTFFRYRKLNDTYYKQENVVERR